MDRGGQTVVINNFPELSAGHRRRVLAGVRPFRKGGIRLEKQQMKNKIVIHNYGHGGAGVSLAPATAEQAAELASSSCSSGSQVYILGSGIIGLMTALECANKGLKVTVLANRIPSTLSTSPQSLITSEVAPGYWLPYHYEFSDQKQHDIRSERSYKKYLQLMQKSKSLRKVPVYQDMDINEIRKKAPPFVSETCRPVTVAIGGRKFQMVYFETVQIHLQHFLQELIAECKKKDIKFLEKKIASVDDIAKLSCKVVVNCLGLGSKTIFNDSNVYGVKGHLLEIANSTKIKGIFGFKHEGQPVKLYCFDDKILIGLTKEEVEDTKINTVLAEELEKRAYSFYRTLNLDPKPKL